MLLDLHLQDGTGIEVCRAVRSKNPSIAGLLLTAAGDDEALAAAVLAGAAGYLVKVSRSSNIMNAVRELQPGTSLMDADSVERASRLLESIVDTLTPPATDDERQIFELLVEGRTDSQITEALASSVRDTAVKVVGLVARLMHALGQVSARGGSGSHHRPD
jgi:DNA-binding NarL/FixJ family response regulator